MTKNNWNIVSSLCYAADTDRLSKLEIKLKSRINHKESHTDKYDSNSKSNVEYQTTLLAGLLFHVLVLFVLFLYSICTQTNGGQWQLGFNCATGAGVSRERSFQHNQIRIVKKKKRIIAKLEFSLLVYLKEGQWIIYIKLERRDACSRL